MIISLIMFLSYFFVVSLSKLVDDDNETINYLFENDEIEHIRNVNMGITCHTYNFDKIEFYKSDSKSEFIDYLDETASQITDRPTMTFISIIFYSIPTPKVVKTEVQKILQFITSPKDYKEYPSNSKNLYKLEITKMDLKNEKKTLFEKLPNLNDNSCCYSEKLTQNVFNIFLLEDISKNNALKVVLRREIEAFFDMSNKKNKNYVMMKILIIEAIYKPEINMFIDLNSRFDNISKLNESLLYRYFIAFDQVGNSNFYCQTSIDLYNKRILNKLPAILEPEFYLYNRSSLFLHKKFDGKSLDYNIKFHTRNIGFEIWKCIDKNDTYTKLLYFLGYVDLERYFGIKIIIKNTYYRPISFKIKISLHKKIIKGSNNEIIESNKNTKQIIVWKDDNDNPSNLLINYSYETDNQSSIGFPLSNLERDFIQENDYEKDVEARKLINFIDFYESVMYGRNYFYFKKYYSKYYNLNDEFCFYKREIWFKYLNIYQIYKVIENSLRIQNNDVRKSNHKIFRTVKNIEVYEFERDYTKYICPNVLNDDIKLNKGFDNHHFFDIELRFYSNIQPVNFFKTEKKYVDVNNFIKIDFGSNKNYFIFFREVINDWTNNYKLYDIKNINSEAKIFLTSSISELLCLPDVKEAERYSINFIEVILAAIKTNLHSNYTIENNLCYNLSNRLSFLFPKMSDIMTEFLNFTNNEQTPISSDKLKLISTILNTSIFIVKRNFKKMLYEACVLRSIANISDNSQEILESLL